MSFGQLQQGLRVKDGLGGTQDSVIQKAEPKGMGREKKWKVKASFGFQVGSQGHQGMLLWARSVGPETPHLRAGVQTEM